MEMGYSLQYSMPNPDGFENVHAFMQAADFHFKPLVKALERPIRSCRGVDLVHA